MPKCPPYSLPDDDDLCPPLLPRALSATDLLKLDGLDRYAVIGEILFQFERRVFNFVVPKNQRFYGYAVRNIEQLISREEDVADRCAYRYNLDKLNSKLKPLGYLPYYHSELSCSIINEYGVLARSASEIRAMSTRLLGRLQDGTSGNKLKGPPPSLEHSRGGFSDLLHFTPEPAHGDWRCLWLGQEQV
ncbi:hypothetical protein RvY_08270 [Ramazzottius varieornatus]|uniref:Speriolin C-terminal domain-containing protein n=1 Tax=Ramazzottius varieornatus TaxID=947166 RepID=A0A1D1V586_RAMVA|nr:hypothetical protein RvY_08270 [Ramazzottius varieornatus]